MDAIKFLKLWDRLCRKNSCKECPLSSFNNQVDIVCYELLKTFPEKAVEIIEAWAKEHPEKTYMQDLLEKFPTARLGTSNTPLACRREIYGAESPSKCSGDCIDCWDEPIEG